jgi:hypothetical protein
LVNRLFVHSIWKMLYDYPSVTFYTGNFMAKCPKCGMEVATPRKSWKMAGRPDKSGKRTELTIGLFDHCGKTFRAVLAKRKI